MTSTLPPHVVTTGPDGTQHYWSFHHSVTDHGLTGSIERERDTEDIGDDKQWTSCEWTCTSQYREGACGRSAYRNVYGLSLCWQHEDAAVRHVVSQIRLGRCNRSQIEDVAAEVLAVGGLDTPDALGGSPIDRLVRAEIRRYLQSAVQSGSWSHGFDDLLDELLTRRLHEKWGSL